jgi:hypothetical protein
MLASAVWQLLVNSFREALECVLGAVFWSAFAARTETECEVARSRVRLRGKAGFKVAKRYARTRRGVCDNAKRWRRRDAARDANR